MFEYWGVNYWLGMVTAAPGAPGASQAPVVAEGAPADLFKWVG